MTDTQRRIIPTNQLNASPIPSVMFQSSKVGEVWKADGFNAPWQLILGERQ